VAFVNKRKKYTNAGLRLFDMLIMLTI